MTKQEPLDLHFDPPLADEDEEEEESAEHVAAVNDSEEDFQGTGVVAIVTPNDELDVLEDPEDAEDKEKLHVEDCLALLDLKFSESVVGSWGGGG